MVAPCKYCYIHSSGCHGCCEFYIEYVKENERKRTNIHNKKYKSNMLRSLKRDGCEKQRRRHKK